jgi:hypothetical protein
VREFLGSEAMDRLGVPTTRALCLVVSDGPGGDTSRRPWYSAGEKKGNNNSIPDVDDPRLARFDMARRREIISQLMASTRSDPDVLVEERCAITTRVSPSFVRIGHLDLFARRVDALLERIGEYGDDDVDDDDDESEEEEEGGTSDSCVPISSASSSSSGGEKTTTFGLPSPSTMNVGTEKKKKEKTKKKTKIANTLQYRELEDMMWHACYREYHDEAYAPHFGGGDAMAAASALMEGAMVRIAGMVGGWIRVGFVQGNFNADNCLVGGRTMDYGPFGFLDVYVSFAIFIVFRLRVEYILFFEKSDFNIIIIILRSSIRRLSTASPGGEVDRVRRSLRLHEPAERRLRQFHGPSRKSHADHRRQRWRRRRGPRQDAGEGTIRLLGRS